MTCNTLFKTLPSRTACRVGAWQLRTGRGALIRLRRQDRTRTIGQSQNVSESILLSVLLRGDNLLATVETGFADVVTTVNFTGRGLNGDCRIGQEVMSTVIAALVGRFLILLNSHLYTPRGLKLETRNYTKELRNFNGQSVLISSLVFLWVSLRTLSVVRELYLSTGYTQGLFSTSVSAHLHPSLFRPSRPLPGLCPRHQSLLTAVQPSSFQFRVNTLPISAIFGEPIANA